MFALLIFYIFWPIYKSSQNFVNLCQIRVQQLIKTLKNLDISRHHNRHNLDLFV